VAAQTGFAIQLTPRNQDGRAPWSVVQDVRFINNVVRHVSSGINILGTDYLHPSGVTNNIVVRNNLFEDVSGTKYGGHGRWLQLTEGGRDMTFDHNTVLQDGWSVIGVSHAVQNFVFTSNIVPDYSWAIIGDTTAPGNSTISKYFPYSTFAANVFAGADPTRYPSGNFYPASMTDVRFVNYVPLTGGNYRLGVTSLYRSAGRDGADVGADIDALNAAAGTSY
jgi:hypothetical protein